MFGRLTAISIFGPQMRGGFAIRIVLILCTLAFVGGGIVFFLQQSRENQRLYQRKAVQICEYGLQRALEEITADPAWRQGFDRTHYGGGWYEVRVRAISEGDTQRIEIESTGCMRTIRRKKTCRMFRLSSAGNVSWTQELIQ